MYTICMQIPENGFYYHYKHDESKGFNDHAYEITGIVRHSEDGTLLATYTPLFENDWLSPATQCVRPIELFFDKVMVEGVSLPHFVKITDLEIIAKLQEYKNTISSK